MSFTKAVFSWRVSWLSAFCFVPRKISNEHFDFELLIYYMLRFFQLVFTQMDDLWWNPHLFNPNFHLQRYIRKFPEVVTNDLVTRTRSVVSISELNNIEKYGNGCYNRFPDYWPQDTYTCWYKDQVALFSSHYGTGYNYSDTCSATDRNPFRFAIRKFSGA
ncbi:uncharacterized protein EV154DRAFT_489125 [Mucor mucedo]|uniref:uncharacterized protein n=1 Tax=Mucor mucedo TaxID=29922 RepID=UPI0022204E23|nr:uncharacterized protein EV154DRAFT_489125 [Mucor mucedo]KAI7863048.1 hypothetical protein EV154DRAFT_489125 [Mucor mucedo]